VIVVVYVGLVLMFPVEILVRFMGVLYGWVVVLMDMFGYQMLNLFLPAALGVMGHMDMLMSMNHFFVSMALKLSSRHPVASFYITDLFMEPPALLTSGLR
jgi:hypothetical protein